LSGAEEAFSKPKEGNPKKRRRKIQTKRKRNPRIFLPPIETFQWLDRKSKEHQDPIRLTTNNASKLQNMRRRASSPINPGSDDQADGSYTFTQSPNRIRVS